MNTLQLKQESELQAEQHKVEKEIADYQQNEKRLKELAVKQQSASDDLDNFMNTLSENVTKVDKTEIKKLRVSRECTAFLMRLIQLFQHSTTAGGATHQNRATEATAAY